jgi:PAS domain S-box-containing protein
MKDNIEKRIIGVFLLMFVIISAVAVAAINNIKRAGAASDWVNHTHAVLFEVNAIVTTMSAGDASLRDYLITGDSRDQTLYRTAYSEMLEHVDKATALTRNESAQNQKVILLGKLVNDRLSFTRSVAKARQAGGLDAARQALTSDPSGEFMGEITRATQQLNDEENALLRDRDKESYLQAQATRWTLIVGISINFLLLFLVGSAVINDIQARRKVARALEDANAQLEIKVQERTAELVTANQSLKAENLERRWSNQALDHQLRYSQLIINSITDLIFVISKALNISRINPAVVHGTGYESQELIPQHVDMVLKIAPDATGQNPIALALKEGRELQNRPATLLSKNGRTRVVRYNLVTLRDQNKVVGGVITVRLEDEAPPTV